jgi:hypothetical protein
MATSLGRPRTADEGRLTPGCRWIQGGDAEGKGRARQR